MERREFLNRAILAAGTAALSPWLGQAQDATVSDGSQVKRVMAIFKCHLDVGFTDTQANVMRKYFDEYFPQAVETAAGLRSESEDHYIWTTGSWLLYEYLEQADAQARKKMEEAILAGDIAWHALPFSWQTEMLDRSMIEGCLGFSASLDRRFGRKTVGAKMTDVPGHTRGIIGPLAAAGVKLLDIGVNPASTPPEVPSAFLWKDTDGRALIMLYHRHAYGDTLVIPHTDLAIEVNVRVDNTGPHTKDEIRQIYAGLRKRFPNATVKAGNLSEVAAAVDEFRDHLPVVTEEIGDTWIYGVPSDPLKVARYREIARLRREWIQQRKFSAGDATDRQLLRWLALAPEHTWGTDTKRYVDYDNYKSRNLVRVLGQPGYKTMERSWQEKRDDIDAGIAALPDELRQQTFIRMGTLQQSAPSSEKLQAHVLEAEIDSEHFVLALDGKTGAIVKLHNKKTGREWASGQHPLALFVYQTLSKADYDRFLDEYVVSKEWWAPRDFGKPNIEHFDAESREWLPALQQCWVGKEKNGLRVLAELKIEDPDHSSQGRAAWPEKMYLELLLPNSEPVVHATFFSINKAPNRMPESMWLTFAPEAPEALGWSLEKVDENVSPLDVVRGGGRSMHAVTSHIRYQDNHGSFELNTLDAPVVAVGERSPLDFTQDLPDMKHGVHVNLFNNAWGTNYIQWGGGDWTYRFTLSVS
jgi:hypothetical protein